VFFFSCFFPSVVFLDALFWLAHMIPNPGQGSKGLFYVSSNLPVNSSEVGVAAVDLHYRQNMTKLNEKQACKFILCSQNFHFVFLPR
jgi:hypothetical protein